MCGFVGQVGENVVSQLPLDTIAHRGPDAQGQWSNGRNCILGHRRLSILDLNSRSNQPMADPEGRFTIVYNGEIYNFEELKRDYLSGEHFLTTSDTEVLLLLWRQMGPKCLDLLVGMFAFAIWDNQENKLYLVRDRFGQKPLVYNLTGGVLTFASELNILAKCIANLNINPEAIDLFLGYQFIPAPYTIYKKTFKLPPAHWAVWDGEKLKIERYWQLKFDEKKNAGISETEAIEMLDESIRRSIRYRLRADVPVGVLLSGGVDSSVITAIAAQIAPSQIQTFSIGFKESRASELEYANQVAKQYNTDHHTQILSAENAEDYLLKSVTQYGEPFGDSSSLPSLMVCQAAAQKLKVVLNGDGGDELLAGYGMFNISPFQRRLGHATLFCFDLGCKLDNLRLHLPPLSFISRRIKKLRRSMSPLHRVLRSDSNAEGPDRIDLYINEFAESTGKLRNEHEQSFLSETDFYTHPVNQLLSIHSRNTFANDFLVKMDIASMAYGLEARSPFIDHGLMELAATLPSKFKMKAGVGKYLLKKMATKYLPKDLLFRRKRGFGLPISEWISTKFNSHIMDMTTDAANPVWDYLKKDTVTTWIEQHGRKQRDHGQRLWDILILGLWLKEH